MDKCGHLSRLSHRDVQLLHERTEGWVAGLRLAAASMEGEPDIHGFVRDLAGEDHSLAGYLMSEVLARQPEDRRRFMLDTSIVDELTDGLAADLTERDDAAAVACRRSNGRTASCPPWGPGTIGTSTTPCSPTSCGTRRSC